MHGSKSITAGRPSTTSNPRISLRVAAAGLGVLLSLAVIFYLKASTSKRLGELQQGFAAIETEAFHLGLHLRAGIHELNGLVLRTQLSDEDSGRELFQHRADELSRRMREALPRLATAQELELARQVQPAFERYLRSTVPLLDRSVRPLKRESVSSAFEVLATVSAPVLELVDKLVDYQRLALAGRFSSSYDSLGGMRRVMRTNTLLLLALLGVTAGLIYAMFVAPLRLRLSQSQAAIADKEKLASLGILAAGVAHEIRNPLMAIKLRLFSFGGELPLAYTEHEDLKVISSEVERLERIVQGFLEFARPSEPRMTRLNAGAVIKEIESLMSAALLQKGIVLQTETQDENTFDADREQVKQVLINLVRNAGDSIQGAGTVTLRVRSGMVTLEKKLVQAVIFEVSDTGKGIAPDDQKQIFEPFYSTKSEGTGLGLAIAARIAEKHGGSLQLYSRINSGSTFSLILPRDHEPATRTADRR